MVLLCCLNVAVDAHRVPAIKVRYPDVVALIGLPVGAAGNDRSMENPYATISETRVGLVIVVGDRAYKLKKPVDLVKSPSCQLEVQPQGGRCSWRTHRL